MSCFEYFVVEDYRYIEEETVGFVGLSFELGLTVVVFPVFEEKVNSIFQG